MRTSTPLHLASLTLAVSVVVSAAQAQPGSSVMPANTISMTSFSPDTFFLNDFARPMNLRHTVAGLTPSHYRVSHFSDFRDARWLSYAPTPVVTTERSWWTSVGGSSTNFSGTVYFQLRARNPNAGQPVALQPGGGGVTTQPDFINSNIRNKAIRLVFAS